MKHFLVSFVDFDNTVYETSRMVGAMRELFVQAGVTPEDFQITRNKTVEGANGQYFDYSFERHIAAVMQLGYTLPLDFLEQLNAILEKESFEMPGAHEFLRWVREVSERVVLVTAGNHDFQHKKLASTKLSSFFDEVVVVHERKGAVVAKHVGEEKGHILFVNDNIKENIAIQEQFPQAMVVGLIQPHKPADYTTISIPFFAKLSEIQAYVSKQI
jgi:FMN phosphatase YigB (HAD superfamily)